MQLWLALLLGGFAIEQQGKFYETDADAFMQRPLYLAQVLAIVKDLCTQKAEQ
ncbi:MAG TPA: hypothetical protein V6C84_16055 [Coleofasciculaceae cyanobacterium]